MQIEPTWSQPSRPTLGRDPLGIQATSVRIYRDLVPGITNVTNRLRYYSFYCWVVHRFEQTQHVDDEARWRIFVRRAEALYALASEIEDPARTAGLAGSDWARAFLRNRQSGRIDLLKYTDKPGEPGEGQYLLARRGNFGQFYIRSMTEIGLLQPSTGVPLVSRPRGQELAEAFAVAIGVRTERLIGNVLTTGKLDWESAEEIGKAVHPALINGNSREMRLLRDFLAAKTSDPVDGSPRRSSAWLLLDLAQRGVSLDDERAIRRAFYYRLLPRNKAYRQTGATIDRWRIYQANELCHIALEVWLNALASRIENAVDGVTPAKLISELVAGAFEEHDLDRPWCDWAKKIGEMTVDEEEQLTENIHDALRNLDLATEKPVLEAATKLLAVLWQRWSGGEHGVRAGLDHYAGIGGCSLAGVLSSLDDRSQTDSRGALTQVLQEHIVEAHLRIAARKLAASDKFTYRFMLADGLLSDGVLTNYGYTNPRLRNLARFLRDAKYCEGDVVTAAGQKFLHENEPA